MAKLGEGDARWIVSERADGTNVNGWHWQEKDCLPWAKQRLGELFQQLPLGDGVTTQLKSVEGDCVLNVRKAKLVASYELDIKAAFEARAGGGSVSGVIRIPYLAEENHDEDPELQVIMDADTREAGEVKRAILGQGKQAIHAAIRTFLDELAAGGPMQGTAGGGSAPGAPTTNGAAPPAAAVAAAAPPAQKRVPPAAPAASTSAHTGSCSFTEQYYCRPADLYECFTTEGKLRAWTQSAATVSAAPGGQFTWFGGGVQGEFVDLQPPHQLTMRWRFSNWEEGCYSKVELSFTEEAPGTTQLALRQSGIPEVDRFANEDVMATVERGWQGQVLTRIRQVFGYGC